MHLYSFFRSGTSHRLRIALNLKGLVCEVMPVDLRTEQHLAATYKAIHRQGLVPALVRDEAAGAQVLIQSPRSSSGWKSATRPAALDAFRLAAPALQPDAG